MNYSKFSMEKLHLSWLVPIFYKKNIHVFYKQPSYKGFDVKNGSKVKQLAKQPPTLKALMEKNFGWILSKKFYFSILSSLKLNCSTTFFGTT